MWWSNDFRAIEFALLTIFTHLFKFRKNELFWANEFFGITLVNSENFYIGKATFTK